MNGNTQPNNQSFSLNFLTPKSCDKMQKNFVTIATWISLTQIWLTIINLVSYTSPIQVEL